ncbi:MAG: sodium:solute symporter family protein [Acidobacteriota bacterium]
MDGSIYGIAIVVYLAVLVGVGVWRSRTVKSQDDFMVAGRSASWLMLVATLSCTWIGSGSLFGGAGRAFRGGFSALWMSAGAWVGIAIVFFLAPKVRRIAQYTVPDILEKRYTPMARLLGTVAIVIAYLTIASYQFIGGGKLYAIVSGRPAQEGQLIIGALVVLVLVLAGMKSIISLDVFNGVLITGGTLVAAPIILSLAGGWSGLTQTLPETHFTVTGASGILPALGLFFPTFFLLLGESGMYQKFMSAKSEFDARKAVVGMIIGVVVIETVLNATAVFGAGLYWTDERFRDAAGAFNQSATETIILQLARFDLPLIAGLVLLLGAVAIIFSTATTFLIVPSTNLTRDIFQRFIRPDADSKTIVLVQRILVVVLAAGALLVTTQFNSILDMALYAYTMVGAAVTPALLAAFLWRRVTPIAGTVSVTAGVVTTVVFGGLAQSGMESLNLGLFQLPLAYDYIIYPAATLSILSLIVVSYVTPESPEEKWRPFWTEAPSGVVDPGESAAN